MGPSPPCIILNTQKRKSNKLGCNPLVSHAGESPREVLSKCFVFSFDEFNAETLQEGVIRQTQVEPMDTDVVA